MVEAEEGRSLTGTPTWAVGTVITVMVTLGFFFQASLEQFGKWLDRTKRKALLAALDKIKDELMLFGLLSLLMGHWIIYVAKICVKSSALSRRFYPCALASELSDASSLNHISVSSSSFMNYSASRHLMNDVMDDYCPEGHESFASRESLEQLHRFLFVLGITHVFYSFVAIALAMIKIYSWRIWENQAKSMALQGSQGSSEAASSGLRMRRLSTFISHQTSHSWSQHRVLVWLLCFSRQFWSSINRADYMALRFGFLTAHQLPLAYDFHNYMLRSMEEEFRDIVGISVPLWIFGIACILLGFHGTNIYFWLSFLPAMLILLVGTKLHRIVVKLAVEIMEASPWGESQKFNLRDELFWFRKPRLLLRLIQFISFQNAFEMASFLWSLRHEIEKNQKIKKGDQDVEHPLHYPLFAALPSPWEIKEGSCFTKKHSFLVIRLTFGVVSQIWCSFVTFPLYVIITQMGSTLKKTIISKSVRNSLHGWQRRVKARQGEHPLTLLNTSSSPTSSDSTGNSIGRMYAVTSNRMKGCCSSSYEDTSVSCQDASMERDQNHEHSLQVSLYPSPQSNTLDDNYNDEIEEA